MACLLVAFYRGFRAPSLWSLNYYQVSWPDGFLRRGMLGTLLYPLGCARFDPHVVWVIQFLVLAGALVLLLRLGRGGAAALALCVFFASDLGMLFFNEVGYPDQILLLLTAACAVFLAKGWTWSAAVLMALAALIHEEAFLTVLPLVLVLWLRFEPSRRPTLWKLLGPIAVVGALLPFLSASVPFWVLQRYDDLSIACGHPLARRDFLIYYQASLGQEFHVYYHAGELVWTVLPLVAGLALWILGGGAFPGASKIERWAALMACCCPLLLGCVGTDKNRWTLLVLLQVMLLLGLPRPSEARPAAPCARLRGLAFALPLIVVVLMMRIRLFDRFVARPPTLDRISGFGAEVAAQLGSLPVQ